MRRRLVIQGGGLGNDGGKLLEVLQWNLVYGKHKENMHHRYAEKDESQIPASLLDEPQLLPGLVLYYEAFWELSSDRQSGFGIGPIPYTSIMMYCRDWDMDDDMTVTFRALIRKMDAHFIKWNVAKEKISKGKK